MTPIRNYPSSLVEGDCQHCGKDLKLHWECTGERSFRKLNCHEVHKHGEDGSCLSCWGCLNCPMYGYGGACKCETGTTNNTDKEDDNLAKDKKRVYWYVSRTVSTERGDITILTAGDKFTIAQGRANNLLGLLHKRGEQDVKLRVTVAP